MLAESLKWLRQNPNNKREQDIVTSFKYTAHHFKKHIAGHSGVVVLVSLVSTSTFYTPER